MQEKILNSLSHTIYALYAQSKKSWGVDQHKSQRGLFTQARLSSLAILEE